MKLAISKGFRAYLVSPALSDDEGNVILCDASPLGVDAPGVRMTPTLLDEYYEMLDVSDTTVEDLRKAIRQRYKGR